MPDSSTASGTALILTVGTNALPVYVAARHLIGHFSKSEAPVGKVIFLETLGTLKHGERIRALLESDGLISQKDCEEVETSAGAPKSIRESTARIVKSYCQSSEAIHLHYTGGSKAMAAESLRELEHVISEGENHQIISSSYLDPHHLQKGRPTVVDQDSQPIGNDPRLTASLSLEQIVELNGYKLVQEIPEIPPENFAESGRDLLNHFAGSRGYKKLSLYQQNLKKWKKFVSDKSELKREVVHQPIWFNSDSSNEHGNPGSFDRPWFKLGVLEAAKTAAGVDVSITPKQDSMLVVVNQFSKGLQEFSDFLCGHWLEFAAFEALTGVINNMSNPEKISLGHSVRALRDVPSKPWFKRDFELDVVAVLGYQIVCVSCYSGTIRARAKLKAFEALARARQIGGDEARAIVLYGGDAGAANDLETDVNHDDGGNDELKRIEVWGRNRWKRLSGEFKEFFIKLDWK